MHAVQVESPERMGAAYAVRFEVFVDEQGVSPEGERDDLDTDPRTLHCVVIADAGDGTGFEAGAILATGRLLAPHSDSAHGEGTAHGAMDPATPHIGRVAVLARARGTGAGRAVMEALEAAALEKFGAPGPDGARTVRVELSAQDQAMPFYERLGYTVHGEGYLDEGIWHHDAYKDLTAP